MEFKFQKFPKHLRITNPHVIYLQEEQFISQYDRLLLFRWRDNKGLKQVAPKSYNLSFSQNPFSVKTHQVQHLVERILLPLEILRLQLRELMIGGLQPPLLEAERKDGLAQGGDGVMESRVVCWCVRIHHFRFLGYYWV